MANGCHWTLDVTYREDESRIHAEHLRETLAWLNRFILSLLNNPSDAKASPGNDAVAGGATTTS